MPKYEILSTSYFDAPITIVGKGMSIAGVLLEPGTVIEYDGIPGPNLEPLDDDAKRAMALADQARVDGLRPLTQDQQDDVAAENPLHSIEQRQQARQFRHEARAAQQAEDDAR